ncbi:autotransporter assembly complex protein TamA [Thalassospira xiamenensis]|uniref:autotransporter assembly complex protein TamA n=1 Tax=Thalassospira xiamenensis TaxID=220697 RepID=UPI001FFE814E|nr:autotransporter assembly complex protein TamA [Thalassospira xiamenensis]
MNTDKRYNRKSRLRGIGVVSVLLMGTALSACSGDNVLSEFGFGQDSDSAAQDALSAKIPYEVQIEGIDPQEEKLLAALRDVSTSIRLQSRPTPSLAGLERRAEDDVERFETVLRSFGFYDGQVSFNIRKAEPDDQNTPDGENGGEGDDIVSAASEPAAGAPDSAEQPDPVDLVYQIDVNQPYLLSEVKLVIVRPDHTTRREATDEELERTNLHLGQRAAADPIILAEQYAVDFMRDRGFPLVEAGKRKVIANTAEKTISVTYELVTGPEANFGKVSVKGAETVDEDFIAGYRSWKPGQKYSPEEVRTTRRDLAQSNLFDSVIVKPVGPVAKNGEIPVEIEVRERKHRTIGGGVDFSTADGPGANAFWENRNLFGAGERLRLGIEGSGQSQGLEATFRKPQFLQRRQALVADGSAKNYSTDAYDGELVETFVGVERKIGDYWSVTLGPTAEYSDLTGADSPNEQFYLGGLRGILRRDSTDNPLDPTEGNRLEFNVSPYTSLSGPSAQFTSVSLNGSQYFAFDEEGDYVLAGRGRAGMIIGEDRSDLPANKRFYSGGGGSVRGYEYQKVGPLDEDGDPLGGRSVLEAGLEFRARVTESFGIVPFVEGGNVFEASDPDDLDLLWATGLGFRYYTAVGPLRFDFAVPLDKRDNVDDDFQIYLSLGQAF